MNLALEISQLKLTVECLKIISSMEVDKSDEVESDVREFFQRISESFLDDNDFISFRIFLKDFIDSSKFESDFKKKYSDTVYHPNVYLYLDLKSLFAKLLLEKLS